MLQQVDVTQVPPLHLPFVPPPQTQQMHSASGQLVPSGLSEVVQPPSPSQVELSSHDVAVQE